MRTASLMMLALGLWMCGEDPPPPTPSIAAPPQVVVEAPLPAPAHGGTVLMAGPTPVEVVAAPSGRVQAYVLAEEQAPNTTVTVRLPDGTGHTHPVILAWDPEEEYFEGRARNFTPVPGPISVIVVKGGETFEATAPTYVVIAEPAAPVHVVHQRPQVQVVQAPPQPGVVIVAPGPPPPPSIVFAPPPPPTIVVGPPPPPGVVIVGPAPPRPVVVGPPGHVRHRYGDNVVVVNPGHGGHGHGHGRGHGH